jgi:HemX protein
MLPLNLLLGGTAALYTLSALTHVLYMFRREFGGLARWSTRIAFLLQTLSLVLVIVQTGRAPVYSLFEFGYAFTWFLMSNYMVIEVWGDNQAAGSFLMPVIAVVQVISVGLPKPGSEHLAVGAFSSSLIGWHVGVIMLGYGFFIASFVLGALYLIQERNLRLKNWSPLYYRLPSLEALDIWSGRFVYIGFPLLTLGIGAGAVFALSTWTSFWAIDLKVLFTCLLWLVYGGYLLMRTAWGWGGRKAAWWSVAGVAALFINYFIINLLSHSHRFGV